MKTAIAILATVFAATAFAAEPAKTADVKPAVVTAPASAPAVVKKDEKKPVKSAVVKDEKAPAAAPAAPAKPASK